MEEKTNAIRIIESKKLPYKSYFYGSGDAQSAVDIASELGKPVEKVYKTLVCVARSGANYVFVIPAAKELDLKKAAKSVGEKSMEMLKQKELFPLTGYVHGGCSPIGMKKLFKTTIDSSVSELDEFCFSGGKIGCQVEMSIETLKKIIPLKLADITVEE